MNRMIDPPKDAAESLAQIGVSAKNADGTVKPFRQQLQELRNAMAGLTDAEKAEIAGNIAGTEAMSGFLAVVNASDADFAKMAGAVDNADGAAAKMAKTMNDNAYGALKELKSALEDVAITIGNTFLEEIAGATGGVTDFIRKIGDFAKEHPKLVAGIVAFVAAAGSLLVILGGIGLALSGVMTAAGALSPVFTAVAGFIAGALGPIIAIIVAVAAAIYFVKENWDLVVAWFQPGLDMMMDGLQHLAQAWEALQPLITALMPLIKFIATLIGGVVVGALMGLWTVASFVFNAIATFIEWVCGLLGGMGDLIKWCADLLSGLIDKALDFIGLKGQIGGINTDTTNRLFDEGRAGNNYTQSQYNNFNLSAANQLQPAMAGTNTWFDNP
jgi:phage-related protein